MHDDADRRHGALKDKEHAREELGSLLRDLTGQLRDAGEPPALDGSASRVSDSGSSGMRAARHGLSAWAR